MRFSPVPLKYDMTSSPVNSGFIFMIFLNTFDAYTVRFPEAKKDSKASKKKLDKFLVSIKAKVLV